MSPPSAPALLRRPAGRTVAPCLDPVQRQVRDRPPGSGPLVLLGAPGTGRTTTVVETLLARVERYAADPSSLLVLAPTRRAAADLRERVTGRLGRTTTEPLARTPHAYAWALLRRVAVETGAPLPRLLTGPEQASLLAELLRGHEAGDGAVPAWPPTLPAGVRVLRGFRDELRDLLMRALEHGLTPPELADLGRRRSRPAWVAAASVLGEYLDVLALSAPGAHDPAAVVADAAAVLTAHPEVLAAERARWSLVAVEDHHESTAATASLLELVAGGGADLLITGDPDATTSTFRGGDPALLAGAAEHFRRADGTPAPTVVLPTRWRHGDALARSVHRVAERIGTTSSAPHRAARPSPSATSGVVEPHVVASDAREAAFVAAVLREEHVLRGTAWSAMAVVVRSTGAVAPLRRSLAAAGVPVLAPTARVPLRAERAVVPFLLALRVVLQEGAPRPDQVLDLLSGPLADADPLTLRRMRRALVAGELARLAAGPQPARRPRTGAELLVAAVTDPTVRADLPRRLLAPVLTLARVLAAGRAACAVADASPGAALWALWSASELAPTWRAQALAGGAAGLRADADLDAVVALFDAADRAVERSPGLDPGQFLATLAAEDVPSDSLAARAAADDAVALLTPAAAAGREWDVVVVPGLVEGAWPDIRRRGTLLGADELADVLTGRSPGPTSVSSQPAARPTAQAAREVDRLARRAVLDDERRLLHVAVSRARRRLVVTAVQSADQRPSAFFDLLAAGERPLTEVPRWSTLPALVAELRGVLLTLVGRRDATGVLVDAARHEQAAVALARLADAGVDGADPAQWHGLAALSDDRPLHDDTQPVRVSPSAVATFSACPLRWLLQACGGSGTSLQQSVGTLVHAVAADLPDGTPEQLAARLEQRWVELGLGQGWIATREQRRARQAVARLAGYIAAARAAGREVLAVEVDVSVQIGRALVRGRLDRVERAPDGSLTIVDLKTGSTAATKAELPRHPQLGLYQAVAEAGGLDHVPGATGEAEHAHSGGAALVQVGAGRKKAAVQEQAALADDPEPTWAVDLLQATADGMTAAAFEARANDHCPTCPVRSCCPLDQP